MLVKNIFIIIFVFCVAGFIIISSVNYSFAASGVEQYYSGLHSTAADAGYKSNDEYGESVLIVKIATVIKIILSFVGVIFLVLMIYAGFTWMLAAGNEQQVEKARKVLIASIIGILIVLSAYAISYLVVSEFEGQTLMPSAETMPVP